MKFKKVVVVLVKRVIYRVLVWLAMQFFEAIKRVVESDEVSVPEGAYLAHVFKMFDAANVDEWQVGFYDSSADEITVFVVSSEGVRKNPPAEAFKREGRVVEELVAGKLVFPPQEAMRKVKESLAKKHPGHPAKQTILLAQTLEGHGQVYNFTVVTETFHMYNVKVSTESGEFVDESFTHLMSLKKE